MTRIEAPATPDNGYSPASDVHNRWGFPRCVGLPMLACCRHYPGGITGCSLRSPSPVIAAFPTTEMGRLPVCSAFNRYGLQARVNDPLHRRLRDDLVTSLVATIATGWSEPLPGGIACH
jgi:hypothetical protein